MYDNADRYVDVTWVREVRFRRAALTVPLWGAIAASFVASSIAVCLTLGLLAWCARAPDRGAETSSGEQVVPGADGHAAQEASQVPSAPPSPAPAGSPVHKAGVAGPPPPGRSSDGAPAPVSIADCGLRIADWGKARPLSALLHAIRKAEWAGPGDPPDGDQGKAIGRYQIWRCYWTDAGLPGRYEDCRNPAYAERVVLAYWRRHAPAELAVLESTIRDPQSAMAAMAVLAKLHSGGPDWRERPATVRYWGRVKAHLDERT